MADTGNNDKVKQILQTVRAVPEGSGATYGQIADLAGLPGRARLAGRSLRADFNGEPVPWHRILRADGKIAFPPGSEKAKEQRELLMAEGVMVKDNRVKLRNCQWQPDMATILFTLKY